MNIADLVAQAADSHGARAAVRDSHGGICTWGDLEQRVAAAAGVVLALGGSQPTVAVMLPNGLDFPVAYWGVLRAGGVVVPVNPAYTPPEVAHLLADSAARLAVIHPALADTAAEAAKRADADVRLVTPADLDGAPVRAAATGGEDVAVICYTSGTTGKPKGACLTHANFLTNLDAFSNLPLLRLDPDDTLLGLLPFFHIFGLNVILNAAARHGACVLALERFSPIGSLEAMASQRVSVAYGAPPVYAAWCGVPEAAVGDQAALRAAVSGADALPVTVWQRFADRFGIEIAEGYGLTETAPVLTSTAASPTIRPGTVGHPLPGVEVRVVGPSGDDKDEGEVGEIAARGDNVFSGYHNQPEATAETFRDGWFLTGDLGAFDADGYLTIAGRLKDMVIVSGFNVYPREVEEAIREHASVAEVAVIGIPDERTGERVRAVVVARDGAHIDAEDLISHCRERLARYKVPREIEVVEALPRLPTGKIRRASLRADASTP